MRPRQDGNTRWQGCADVFVGAVISFAAILIIIGLVIKFFM